MGKRERDRRELVELAHLYGTVCELSTVTTTSGLADFGCTGWVEHLHHIEPRRTGGNERTNILAICSSHHRWIHAHPQEARNRGWLGSSLGTIQTPTRRP